MFGRRSQSPNELAAPFSGKKNSDAVEILRAWTSEEGLHVSLRPEIWADSAAWGIAIADIIRHSADAYKISQSVEPEMTIERIVGLLHAELDAPTDKPSGNFVN